MRRPWRGSRLLATAVAWSVVLAACGAADDEPVAGGEPASTPTALADQTDQQPAPADGEGDNDEDEAVGDGAPGGEDAPPPSGDVLPASTFDAAAVTVDGAAYDLSQLAGTDVVLWFWAPW